MLAFFRPGHSNICTVPALFSPTMFKKQDGMLAFFWFPSSVLRPSRCLKITETIYQKSDKHRYKLRPGVVPGALGGDLGAILAPRRPKAQKTSKKWLGGPPPRGQVGSPFWHIFAAKSPTNGKKREKMSSNNAPWKRSLARRVQSVIFDDSYTLSAVFSGARGYQNGAQMEAKMEQKRIQRVQVTSKIDFLKVLTFIQKYVQRKGTQEISRRLETARPGGGAPLNNYDFLSFLGNKGRLLRYPWWWLES